MTGNKIPARNWFVRVTLPIPGFAPAICLAVFRFPGNGVQLSPGVPAGQVPTALFLLGKLLVGNEFFHQYLLLMVSGEYSIRKRPAGQ